jgi:glycosyltransferase involved in cell wall biosynthesis
MRVEYPFLFNFAASYSEGGYKRLHEYARWFDRNGGAWFAIHPRCERLRSEFPGNRYFEVSQSHFKRLYDDCSYLDEIGQVTGRPELYYAYGIPLYRRFGRINWFHLQNALTVGAHQVPLSMFHRLKFRFLGSRFRRGFAFADVISAESQYSLGLFEVAAAGRKFLSVNGNDDELARLAAGGLPPAQEIATAVGTLSYKALGESFRIFQTLRERRPNLQLQVIGDAKPVPGWLRRRSEVILHGRLEQPAVIDMLRRSRFYIASTYVENSYNGAAEGAFLAQESFISDIPPHHELLQGETCELTRFAGLDRPFFHLHRDALKGTSLKSWHTIITQMIGRARNQNPGTAQIIELPRIAANAPAAPDDRPRRRLPR